MKHLTKGNFFTVTKTRGRPALVMFYRKWCGKCSAMKSVLSSLEKRYSEELQVYLVEADMEPDLAEQYHVGVVPKFVLFKNGQVEMTMEGIISEEIFLDRIKKCL